MFTRLVPEACTSAALRLCLAGLSFDSSSDCSELLAFGFCLSAAGTTAGLRGLGLHSNWPSTADLRLKSAVLLGASLVQNQLCHRHHSLQCTPQD